LGKINTVSSLIGFLRDKHALWYKALLFSISIVVIVWLLPKQNRYKYEFNQAKGKPWNYENLIAPFDFPIYKTESDFEKEKTNATNESKLYFVDNSTLLKEKINSFDTIIKDKSSEYLIGKEILETIANKGIIENNELLQNSKEDKSIYVLNNGIAEEKDASDFYNLSSADKLIVERVNASTIKNKNELINQLENCIAISVFYDDSLTKKFLSQELNNILPTKNKIVKGQIIISRGEIISDEKYEILNSFKIELNNAETSTADDLLLLLGQFIAAFLCMSMIFLFLAFFRKNIFAQNTHVSFIVLVTLLFVFLANRVSLTDKVNLFIIPFTIAPIIIRAFFDTRTALFTHLNIVLLTSFFAGDKFEFFFIQTLAGIAAIFSIANMVRRSQLIVSGIVVLLVYSFAYTSLSLILETQHSAITLSDYYAYAASSLMILIAYPMIFIFEKLFGFVSDFTLLELADSNSTLLRELATRAPGTFQHTLQVASLAEEAIQKVGGNPLLIRTGAMYHDIGKMENPRYFTENQVAGSNPHEELSYEESAHLIINHVIKGVELARKNRIPEQIIDFIRTHHGTSLTRYFYKKSVNEFGATQTDEENFRYPGPVPFSKETAVLMMADSIEASSRSLKNYDAVTIDELVERIINSQIEEQQFINSDITFRDINVIKKIFKKRLMNIYHVRIEYPR
jgi:putative nucleotidyltransferase with HDIG domain